MEFAFLDVNIPRCIFDLPLFQWGLVCKQSQKDKNLFQFSKFYSSNAQIINRGLQIINISKLGNHVSGKSVGYFELL